MPLQGSGRPTTHLSVRHLPQRIGLVAWPSSEVSGSSSLRELTLDAPIRYAAGDGVEAWLHRALCLDQPARGSHSLARGLPSPKSCGLYAVNRDALFSYHALSENFLQRVMALYTAAHYKNQPNDLQLLSDAPQHRLYVLLGPVEDDAPPGALPDVLCVIQVALEGAIAGETVKLALARGERAAGDLVPWTLSQQFCDADFAKLSGARIVRVATHPDAQRMGYGARAMELLLSYFEGDIDECEDSNGGCGNALCHNSAGTHRCPIHLCLCVQYTVNKNNS